MTHQHIVIIGGGILGLATAYRLTVRLPGVGVTLLEKEPELARHQTGRNSGVLHSGVYYTPGSMKARTCTVGKRAMEAFCRSAGVPYNTCGKVILATSAAEVPRLERLRERARANGVVCEPIGLDALREREPHATGIQGLLVPGTGIVDFTAVSTALADRVRAAGGEVRTGVRVTGVRTMPDGVVVETTSGPVDGALCVNCAGLHADRVAALAGADPPARIVPFRGEYYQLREDAQRLCRHLIYPVPDPAFPFLGVHFTRRLDGTVECGPNAVLAFAREGYRKRDINVRDLAESLSYSGFVRLARRHWRMGLGEMWRSVSKSAFVRALQRLVPDVQEADLVRAQAGVRAQAVMPDGTLADDFLLVDTERTIHVCNAPSPAATASLAIADTIVDRVEARLPEAGRNPL